MKTKKKSKKGIDKPLEIKPRDMKQADFLKIRNSFSPLRNVERGDTSENDDENETGFFKKSPLDNIDEKKRPRSSPDSDDRRVRSRSITN